MTEPLLTPTSADRQPSSAEAIDNYEFFARFTREVSQAGEGDQISMSTLCFDPHQSVTAQLAFELIGARKRGAEVRVAIDDFGYLLARQVGMVATGPLRDARGLARRQEVEQSLKMMGAKIGITNQDNIPFSPLFRMRGRNHTKIYAVNDTAYVHGLNLFDAMRLDVGVELRDPVAADVLHGIVTDLVETGSTQAAFQGKDQRLSLPNHGELLLDAGKPGQSVIMNEALAMIDNAQESITMTTQYAPHGALIRHMRAAEKRGVQVNVPCSVSNVRMERVIFGAVRAINRLIYSDTTAGYCIPESLPELHSKALIVDAGIEGKEAAMVGSHGYDPIGVRLGNAELSYLSRDPAFIAKLGEIVLAQTTLP